MIDVCLILEGTYPYITGGVSTWVHDLINGLPQVRFAIVHLTVGDPTQGTVCFDLPKNLEVLATVEISGYQQPHEVARWHPGLVNLPEAGIYHALSTGYAGLLGVEIKKETGRPLILTEHGIYWYEIAQGALEVECGFRVIRDEQQTKITALRSHWTTTFKQMSRTAYSYADEIVTVCRANQKLQLQEGAPAHKCRVISNGIPVQNFNDPEKTLFQRHERPVIGMVGRVVPLKDVETFIRAAALLLRKIPGAIFRVIGPTDHDPDYYNRCRLLANALKLSVCFAFTGERSRQDCYKEIDVLVLTSRSEALPLVMLEAMAVGIPVVVTSVGGCRELINGGHSPGDKAIGPAGLLTAPDEPQQTADAIYDICSNPKQAIEMGCNGRNRVKMFYDQKQCIDLYNRLYKKYISRREDDIAVA